MIAKLEWTQMTTAQNQDQILNPNQNGRDQILDRVWWTPPPWKSQVTICFLRKTGTPPTEFAGYAHVHNGNDSKQWTNKNKSTP